LIEILWLEVINLKLAVYLHGIAPYDEALFRGISKCGISVHLFVGGKFVDRPYWSEGKNISGYSFRETYLKSSKLNLGKYVEYLNPKILSEFRKERYDAVLVPFGSFTGLLLLFAARLSGAYTLSWCGVQKIYMNPVRVLAEPMVRLCLLLSTHFIAYSGFSKRYLIKEGANPNRIFVLNPNGVDVQKLSPETNPGDLKERLGISANKNVVLYVGRLEKEKGKSMRLVLLQQSNAHLLIVGIGSQRRYLENLVHELNIEKNVTFVGAVPNEVINKYYALCDLHVAPSIVTKSVIETFGMVYQEAMASGKPSLAFNIPAPLREIIIHGETGYLAPEKDVMALAHYISLLLGDDEKRAIMGKNARKRAVENYDIERVAERWADSLKLLVSPK
jgi:phosphatidylinositol alpha-1,6-mannosyltransferase